MLLTNENLNTIMKNHYGQINDLESIVDEIELKFSEDNVGQFLFEFSEADIELHDTYMMICEDVYVI